MALIEVAPIHPRAQAAEPQQKPEDWTDKLLKGLQIAHGITGIVSNVGEIKQNSLKNAALEDTQNNTMSGKEYADSLAKGLQPVPEGTPGSVLFKHRTGPEDTDIETTPLALAAKPQSPMLKDVGKDLVSYDPLTGTATKVYSGPLEPKTREVQTVDDNGNPVTRIVADTVGSSFPARDKSGADLDKELSDERKELARIVLNPSQRTEIGSLKRVLDTGSRLKAQLDQYPTGELPPMVQTDTAVGYANMISPGSAPDRETIAKMDPQTRGTFIANLLSKALDRPIAADNPEFTKLFRESIDTQMGVARNRFGEMTQQMQAAAPNFYAQKPDEFYRLMGLKKENFDKNNNYIPESMAKGQGSSEPSKSPGAAAPAFRPTPSGGEEDPATRAYANAYTNGDYNQAAFIRQSRKAPAK